MYNFFLNIILIIYSQNSDLDIFSIEDRVWLKATGYLSSEEKTKNEEKLKRKINYSCVA